mgnify:CR=1 FL=1
MKYILSFDLGTGGTKASLFDEEGRSLASAFVSCETFYPRELFHEQRPDDWWRSVVESTRTLLEKAPVDRNEIVCLAVSGHSLGVTPVDAQGKLLTEYTPIWSDSRACEQAKCLFETLDEETWYLTTGNGFPAANYGIFKIMWCKEHQPDVYEKAACFLGTKDYVNLRLTGRMATDHSYASGSGVYDLKKRSYVDSWIEASGVDRAKMPELLESTDIVGTLTPEAAQVMGLPQSVMVAAGGVDNACMCLGAACTHDGDSYTSLGTSAWIAVASHEPVVNAQKRPYVFAHCIPGMVASATSIFSAGNSFRWLKNNLFKHLEVRADAEGRDVYDLLTELAATAPAGSHKLIFNPSLAGGSGLDRSQYVRGCYTGLTLAHTASDVVRATLEGICMGLRTAMDVLGEQSALSDEMLIVGGGGKSQFWRSLFASIYNKTIIETNVGQDAGSLGAAAVAAVGAGLWDSYDRVRAIHTRLGAIAPNPELNRIYEAILPIYAKISDYQCHIGDMLQELRI